MGGRGGGRCEPDHLRSIISKLMFIFAQHNRTVNNYFTYGKKKTILFHRRNRKRINTEDKAKVIAAVWGKEFIHFLTALAILH